MSDVLDRDNTGYRELMPIDTTVGIIDFGGQLAANIDRVVRENNVRSELVSHDVPYQSLDLVQAKIFSGGPRSVYERRAPKCDTRFFDDEKPTLGICYGMGLIVKHFGGEMRRLSKREDGPRTIQHNDDTIFANTPDEQIVWMSHGDSLVTLPQGFEVIAWSGDIPAAIANHERRIYGVQFHPESQHTQFGKQLIGNFLLNVAGIEPDFTLKDQLDEIKASIEEKLPGDQEALIALSGGVDSSTAVKILQAMGKRYKAFHIDHGCMRKGESEQVLAKLRAAGIDVTVVDAAAEFFEATTQVKGRFGRKKTIGPLSETADPEHKRIIMGNKFIDVFGRLISEEGMHEDTILVQGSIRPDKIESGADSKKSAKIKTHHNASPAAQALIDAGKVCEPLQNLYKDQVRAVAEELGLPNELVWRQPFPGPGLGIRILGDTPLSQRERRQLGKLQDRLDDFLPRSVHAKVLRQKLVGVQGDDRTYKPTVALPSYVSWGDALEMAQEIPGHIHGLNRVLKLLNVDAIGDAMSATHTRVTPETVRILQEADYVTDVLMQRSGEHKAVSQFPVMLSYQNFGFEGRRMAILRPFITKDFMTGRPAVPGEDISERIVKAITYQILDGVPNIKTVAYDCSTKPSGTTEGE